jgi:branched-chain amino acid aminotransferase
MSMADRDGFIWMDGEWLPWRDANVHVLTHTLHYGMGVFEGIRAYETDKGPAIFRLEEHTKRFFDSCHILQLKVPFDTDTLIQVQKEVITRNELPSGYIRPLAFLGSEGMGLRADNLKTHVAIAAWPWGAYLGKENLERGIKVRTSSYTRHHINVSMCKAKATGHYINSILALHEALACGCDEAMLLDAQGYVAEGSGENLFLVNDGVLYTPQLTSCLNGITRNTIFDFAQRENLKILEKPITRDEVYICDEAFFTGTAAEVTPIREVDGRIIGSGKRGPITERLQSLYFDVVSGKNPEYDQWLTYVAA